MFALTGATRLVRLSEIDKTLRLAVASKLAADEGLRGYDYLDLMSRADQPQDDPVIEVDEAKVEWVLGRGRQPPGSSVRFS